MPGATARRGIPTPLGTDPVSEFRLAITAAANAADTDAIYSQGTLSARPAATAVPAGTFYYATDTGLLYEGNGTVWGTVMVAGAWQALTLYPSPAVSAGAGYTPAARLVGDVVSLCGNGTGSSIGDWATIPSGLQPAELIVTTANTSNAGTPVACVISTAGVISSWPPSDALSFDSIPPFRLA
jgi:hypothetical protein